jgi:peptidoglycan/xylan/chitin deacetylase (PgdA/CDA1 family)
VAVRKTCLPPRTERIFLAARARSAKTGRDVKTRGKVLVGIVVLAALAVVFWIVARPAEPRYQGKRLSEWLRESPHCEGCGAVFELAAGGEPIRKMGTNALPFLVKELGARDPRWLVAAVDLLDKQDFVSWRPKLTAFQRREAAYRAIATLGAVAEPAIPQISLLLTNQETAPAAVGALIEIGPAALPTLIAALTNRNTQAREDIPYALVQLPGDVSSRLPLLLDCFKDPDPRVRLAAVSALARVGANTDVIVPALLSLLADPDADVREASIGTLGKIRAQPQVVVPALIPFVSDTDPITKIKAITALGAFGQDAASAIPALQKAASSPDFATRSRAKWALTRVHCEMRDGAIVRGPKASRAIALVFTGHEFAEGGETILDELKKHQARASFFLTGDFMVNTNFDRLLGRIINENHLLGPHSDKHLLYCSWERDRKTLVTREQFRADLQNNRDKIRKAADRLDEQPILLEAGTPLDPQMLEAYRRRYGLDVNAQSTTVPEQEEQSAASLTSAKVAEAFQKRYGERGVTNQPVRRIHTDSEFRYFLPPYEHYNREIADWTAEQGMTLINFTPGTRSNADYTGEADKNFVPSQVIFDSILKKEREDPHGLNGFLLLLHIGAGPGRADKFHHRFGELLDVLTAKGYQFVRVDELREPKETK